MYRQVSVPASSATLFSVYYAATLVFAVLDYVFGINVRVAFLDEWPAWRLAYYAACVGFLLLIRRFPGAASGIAALESLFNLCALIIETGIKVMLPHDLDGRGFLGVQDLVNFMLSGGMGYAAWQMRSRAWFEGLR